MVIYHHNLMRDGTHFQRQVQMFHGRGNAACSSIAEMMTLSNVSGFVDA